MLLSCYLRYVDMKKLCILIFQQPIQADVLKTNKLLESINVLSKITGCLEIDFLVNFQSSQLVRLINSCVL